MIVTITLNPAIDKTASIPALYPRALNRLRGVLWDVGGKGLNVSKTIAALGGSSTAIGFLAGEAGHSIQRVLENTRGITPDLLFIRGETRTNLKLVEPDGSLTELNEQGPAASEKDLAALVQKIGSYAAPGNIFVLSGSAGPGVPEDFYRRLVDTIHAGGAKVVLDADGPLLSNALEAAPDVVKPNEYELCQLFGRASATTDELAEMGRELNARGIGLACISRGAQGAVFAHGGQVCFAPGLHVEASSSVGAGDAMAAAIAYSMDQRFPLERCMRLALAAGAAACTTPGTRPPDSSAVQALEQQVRLEWVGAV